MSRPADLARPPPPEVLGRPVKDKSGKTIPFPSTKPPTTPASGSSAARGGSASGGSAMAASKKYDKLLTEIYYDKVDGFGSIQDTYAAAKKRDPSITMKIVKDFLDRQTIRQKKKDAGFNSFVADEALQTIQIDVAYFTKNRFKESPFGFAFFAVDIFSKKLAVIPMKTSSADDCIKAITQVFEKLIGLPKQVYSDEDGAFKAKEFVDKMKYYDVEHQFSRTPPAFVERTIRTVKEQVKKRQDTHGGQWQELLPFVVDRYNQKEHATTKVAPEDAADRKYEEVVRNNIEKKATFNRDYGKDMPTGSKVRLVEKKGKFGDQKFDKDYFREGHDTVASKQTNRSNVTTYKLANPSNIPEFSRPFLRHELKFVPGREAPKPVKRRATTKRAVRFA